MKSRRQIIQEKLLAMTEEEAKAAIKAATGYLHSRITFEKARKGIFSDHSLGIDPYDYFIGLAITKLHEGSWDWQFEEFSYGQQLVRIIGSLVSNYVEKSKIDKNKPIPKVDIDIADLYEISPGSIPDRQEINNGEPDNLDIIYDYAIKCSEDDDDLHYFTILFFENKSSEEIAAEMGVDVKIVYQLKKKLVRRLTKLMSTKEEVQNG